VLLPPVFWATAAIEFNQDGIPGYLKARLGND
jgi:hypothetical protein